MSLVPVGSGLRCSEEYGVSSLGLVLLKETKTDLELRKGTRLLRVMGIKRRG
ncbi:uncharacterized protein RCO7_15076 [Rhynchosporium graminicola]|uniref:Uncharacterized protein n=1 Tax=Rhynchosporium graminicola TaxID=2792576 RepID=A0A1E1LJ61_9HELO|nr:uncharacterized protein RCO7_15076 [Rhynchosporium commune]